MISWLKQAKAIQVPMQGIKERGTTDETSSTYMPRKNRPIGDVEGAKYDYGSIQQHSAQWTN